MRNFAIYLPQFHEFNENNEWWGKGYTEWTPVKKATPLYKGHMQPKIPLNTNYYCLLDKETVIWQSNLAEKYGVDGFVYYHYYFNGKLLMEKPAENLLLNKEINHNFFFCWANHSWYKKTENGNQLLIEQTYGNIDDWSRHFDYLLPFFMDSRYEKKDNKPVFMIYNYRFTEKKPMMDYFDKKCKEVGFEGIYLIETYIYDPTDSKKSEDFYVYLSEQTEQINFREPAVSCAQYWNSLKGTPRQVVNKIKRLLSTKGVNSLVPRIDGNELFNFMTNRDNSNFGGLAVAPGLFFEWDNTPRHSGRGYIINPPTKDVFFKYMNSLSNAEYLIINAWNEWAEGMMLEPTEQNGHKYLEWIREWKEKTKK